MSEPPNDQTPWRVSAGSEKVYDANGRLVATASDPELARRIVDAVNSMPLLWRLQRHLMLHQPMYRRDKN